MLCGLRLLYFFICRSVDCMWMFLDCSYVMWSKIYQMSCHNVEERWMWSLKYFWEILFICNLVKLMRSLVRIRPVLWRMFVDFFVPRWSLSCRNFGMMLLSLQHFRTIALLYFSIISGILLNFWYVKTIKILNNVDFHTTLKVPVLALDR